ncbi:MAG: hypothetical protein KDK61_07090, partial [Simkania sp.]|nr:hypothetical protein [Simkania sp.]
MAQDGTLLENPALRGGKLSEYFFLQIALRAIYYKLNFFRIKEYSFITAKDLFTRGAAIPKTNRIILPSSWERGRRAKQQLLNDALAFNNKFGCPDYFLTVTANPNWKEIRRNLLPGEEVKDRFDLIHRVFNIKMEEITKEIKAGCLGDYQAMVRVVEYQKRGLPHFHMLLWVQKEHKPRSPEILDKIINAQVPDAELQPWLYRVVSERCTHTRCDKFKNSQCRYRDLKTGKMFCKSSFPKPFCETSLVDTNQIYV